jgi:hypothetical protein
MQPVSAEGRARDADAVSHDMDAREDGSPPLRGEVSCAGMAAGVIQFDGKPLCEEAGACRERLGSRCGKENAPEPPRTGSPPQRTGL